MEIYHRYKKLQEIVHYKSDYKSNISHGKLCALILKVYDKLITYALFLTSYYSKISSYVLLEIIAILEREEWVQEASLSYCRNNERTAYIRTQLECQALCIANYRCVGISYSGKKGHKWCYVCKDDKLSLFYRGYGFYRRPGKAPTNK